jgi:hypothetical protein
MAGYQTWACLDAGNLAALPTTIPPDAMPPDDAQRHGATARYLKDLRQDVEDEIKDMAEGKLFEAIQAGEPWAIRYFLTRRAADRGYGNTAHIEHGGVIEKTVKRGAPSGKQIWPEF